MQIIHYKYGRNVRYDRKIEKLMKSTEIPEFEMDWVWNELRKLNLISINAYRWRKINKNGFKRMILMNHSFAKYCMKIFLKETKSQKTVKLQRKELYEKQNGKCYYCDKEMNETTDRTRDHINPVSKGGLNLRFNIVLCCGECNSLKSNKYGGIRCIVHDDQGIKQPLKIFNKTNNSMLSRIISKSHIEILTKISGNNVYGGI